MGEKVAEKMVAIINQGGATLVASTGRCGRGQSIEVPEKEAETLLRYKHIVLASSVVKSVGDAEGIKKENVALQTQVAELQKKLQDFLGATSKKQLEELQEKHGAEKAEEPAKDEPASQP
jgi:hypothetical protein